MLSHKLYCHDSEPDCIQYSVRLAQHRYLSFANVTSANSSGVTVTSSPTSSCVGTTHTITSGENCNSISTSQRISTTGLLSANNLLAFCTNFPTSGTLCIPTASQCTVYSVQTGDTCASIGTKNSASWAQIVSWNPALGRGCANLANYVGYEICISNPGGSWVNPSPSLTTTASTTSE
jgi:LysM repeat protein